MRPIICVAALCALSLPALASAGQQHNHAHPQSVKQLKQTLQNAAQAEIASSEAPTSSSDDGGSASNYCESSPNSQGHSASIGMGGSLDLTLNTFALTVNGQIIHPASFGMFTYGTQPYNVPFGNGHLCVAPFNPGIFRMPVQALTQPTVTLAMEDSQGSFSQFAPAQTWYFQFWYRDPNAGGSNFNLSDGLRVTFAPAHP